MKIKIKFGRPKSGFVPISWIIRLVDWVPYSHTWFEYSDKVFDSRLSGTKESSLEEINYFTISEKEYEIDEIEFIKFRQKYEGAKYSYIQLVGILLARMFYLKKNPFNLKDHLVCSKLLCFFIKQFPESFVKPLPNQDIDLIGIKTMYTYINE